MKKLIFIALIVSFWACSTSGTTDESVRGAFSDLPPGAIQEPYSDNDRMVRVSTYAADGSVLQQGDYLDGIREGAWTEFHPNGFVKQLVGYVNGLKQGQQLEMDNRGQLEARSTYYQDELHGDYVKYNRSRIKEKRLYDNGKLNGLKEKFYDNGTIMEQSNYVNGQMNGID